MKNYSVQSILDWLETKNYLSDRRQAEAFVLTHNNVYRMPLYIHILMAFGALVGSVCVMSLLMSTQYVTLDSAPAFFISGGVFMSLSLLLYYLLRYQTPLLQSFGLQTALIFMIVGKILMVFGFYILSTHPLTFHLNAWLITIGLFIVTIATYFIYPNQIDRFLSSTALLGSVLYNTIMLYDSDAPFFIFFIALTALCGFSFIFRRKSLSWSPLGYAIVICLCASAIMITLTAGSSITIPTLYFNIVLSFALISLCIYLGKEKHAIILPSTIVACLGIALLTPVATPGILVSLGLLVIGYAKHELLLNIIGGIFLCLCLVVFYYSLPYTLDYKAAMLVSTGVILLVARGVVKLMKWDQGYL